MEILAECKSVLVAKAWFHYHKKRVKYLLVLSLMLILAASAFWGEVWNLNAGKETFSFKMFLTSILFGSVHFLCVNTSDGDSVSLAVT